MKRCITPRLYALILLSAIGVYTFGIVSVSLAAGDPSRQYTLLESVGTAEAGKTTNFSTYMGAIFVFMVRTTITLAVVMLVIAGVQYTSAGVSESQAKEARGRITSIVTGLLLALVGFIILRLVNPQLIDFKLEIPDINTKASTAGASGLTASPRTVKVVGSEKNKLQGKLAGRAAQSPIAGDEAQVREKLAAVDISINNSPCPKGQTKGCTNVGGLGEDAVKGLAQLRGACNCPLTITGGTEDGHQTHGVGKDIVDLSIKNPNLEKYVNENTTGIRIAKIGTYHTLSNGDIFLDETNGGGPRHWHVVFASRT